MSAKQERRLLLLALVQGVGYAAALGWNVIGARVCSVHVYGVVAFAMSLVLALQVVFEAGHQRTLVRFMSPLLAARDGAGATRLGHRALSLPLLLAGLAALAAGAVLVWASAGEWGGVPAANWLLLLPAGLGAALMNVQTGAYIAGGRAIASSVLSLVAVPAFLCAAFLLLGRAGKTDGGTMLLAIATAYAAGGAFAAWRLVRGQRPAAAGPGGGSGTASDRVTGEGSVEGAGERPGAPVVPRPAEFYRFAARAQVVALVTLGLGYADRFLLGAFASFAAVGLYSLPARTARLLNLPVYFLNPVAGPVYAAANDVRGVEKAVDVYRRAARFIASVVMPLGLVCAAYSTELLVQLGGSAYAGAAGALSILAVGLVIVTLTGNSGLLLQMGGYETAEVRATVAGLGTNVALALALIRPLGITGVAIGTAAGLFVVACLRLRACHTRWQVTLGDLVGWRQAAAAGGFLAVALLGRALDVPWLGAAVLATVACVLVSPPWQALRQLTSALTAGEGVGRGQAEP